MPYRASYLAARAEDPRLPQSWVADGLELTREPDFAEFVRRLRLDAERDFPRPAGWVPCTTLWWVEDAEFLARVTIRHDLVGTLKTLGGHIGYWVRPSARRRHIGTRAFLASLPYANDLGIDPVLVTCDQDNIGSRRIIESGGGRFENVIGIKRRYWVPTGSERVVEDGRRPRNE
jgi:predicted acetyltransferase